MERAYKITLCMECCHNSELYLCPGDHIEFVSISQLMIIHVMMLSFALLYLRPCTWKASKSSGTWING